MPRILVVRNKEARGIPTGHESPVARALWDFEQLAFHWPAVREVLSSRSLRRGWQAAARRGVCFGPAGACAGELSRRLVGWGRAAPAGRRVAVVSSRLSRDLATHRPWFQALWHLAAELAPTDVLLTASGCTATKWLERLALHLRMRVMHLDVPPNTLGVAAWLQRLCRAESSSSNLWRGLLSPPVLAGIAAARNEQRGASTPLADQWLIESADELLVLHLRPGSRLLPALRGRLAAGRCEPNVRLAVGPGLVGHRAAGELLEQGASVWRPLGWRWYGRRVIQADGSSDGAGQILTCPPPGDFLFHCTRRVDGPWPGQRPEDYLDDVLFERPSADHSPLGALRRMLTEERIAASSQGIRGGSLVVCFTGVTWNELPQLRQFRPHRMRWDFMHFGMAIDRAWLVERGTRAVVYGDDAQWEALDQRRRPFFQLARGRRRSRRNAQPLDWTVEREWRHLGDVQLQGLGPTQAFLFVASREDAQRLARVSRWPVVVLGQCQDTSQRRA